MRTAGIIAEYNPFHRGHRYHMEETRRQTGADYIIAVMSGCYVQRGEPAVVDKYVRTRMALDGGADLVLELPVVYATASAEYFASAGVRLLDSLGCVDVLSFGSEYAGVDDFAPLVKILSEEPPIYQKKTAGSSEVRQKFPVGTRGSDAGVYGGDIPGGGCFRVGDFADAESYPGAGVLKVPSSAAFRDLAGGDKKAGSRLP